MLSVATAATSSRSRKGIAAQVSGWAATLVKPFVVWNNRRQIGNLMTLDERMLADLGLTRGDIAVSLSTSFLHDPSHQLTQLAQERRNLRHARQRASRAEL
jgi:uncharacterized protein YjiS (DUF1127 family)